MPTTMVMSMRRHTGAVEPKCNNARTGHDGKEAGLVFHSTDAEGRNC